MGNKPTPTSSDFGKSGDESEDNVVVSTLTPSLLFSWSQQNVIDLSHFGEIDSILNDPTSVYKVKLMQICPFEMVEAIFANLELTKSSFFSPPPDPFGFKSDIERYFAVVDEALSNFEHFHALGRLCVSRSEGSLRHSDQKDNGGDHLLSEASQSGVESLPFEVLQEIATFIPMSLLPPLFRVSRTFSQALAQSDHLWETIAQLRGIRPPDEKPQLFSWRHHLRRSLMERWIDDLCAKDTSNDSRRPLVLMVSVVLLERDENELSSVEELLSPLFLPKHCYSWAVSNMGEFRPAVLLSRMNNTGTSSWILDWNHDLSLCIPKRRVPGRTRFAVEGEKYFVTGDPGRAVFMDCLSFREEEVPDVLARISQIVTHWNATHVCLSRDDETVIGNSCDFVVSVLRSLDEEFSPKSLRQLHRPITVPGLFRLMKKRGGRTCLDFDADPMRQSSRYRQIAETTPIRFRTHHELDAFLAKIREASDFAGFDEIHEDIQVLRAFDELFWAKYVTMKEVEAFQPLPAKSGPNMPTNGLDCMFGNAFEWNASTPYFDGEYGHRTPRIWDEKDKKGHSGE